MREDDEAWAPAGGGAPKYGSPCVTGAPKAAPTTAPGSPARNSSSGRERGHASRWAPARPRKITFLQVELPLHARDRVFFLSETSGYRRLQVKSPAAAPAFPGGAANTLAESAHLSAPGPAPSGPRAAQHPRPKELRPQVRDRLSPGAQRRCGHWPGRGASERAGCSLGTRVPPRGVPEPLAVPGSLSEGLHSPWWSQGPLRGVPQPLAVPGVSPRGVPQTPPFRGSREWAPALPM